MNSFTEAKGLENIDWNEALSEALADEPGEY